MILAEVLFPTPLGPDRVISNLLPVQRNQKVPLEKSLNESKSLKFSRTSDLWARSIACCNALFSAGDATRSTSFSVTITCGTIFLSWLVIWPSPQNSTLMILPKTLTMQALSPMAQTVGIPTAVLPIWTAKGRQNTNSSFIARSHIGS